ncbi:hypothetical protein LOD99_11629 [Oopsacas minuta]|uniref:Uncharacterized protein n=1 Tax=Oopsacas minuta TaxID=111878 RepID=A0AAV7JJZ1_9METZ|nr:hypothetical protein LOD99_11629 [Oopsacas minuta]
MKYLVILFALIVSISGQDLSCKATGLDSFVLNTTFFGSSFNKQEANEYYSLIGIMTEATDYISDNPQSSMKFVNSTIRVNKGLTGEEVLEGWFWSLTKYGKQYRLQKVHGQLGNCSSVPAGQILPTSKVLKRLFTIYPEPGVEPKPGSNSICQGLIGQPTPNTIMNIVWNGSEKQGLKDFSTLASSSSIHHNVTSLVELEIPRDKHYFDNPCEHATASNVQNEKYSELIEEIYKLMGIWN